MKAFAAAPSTITYLQDPDAGVIPDEAMLAMMLSIDDFMGDGNPTCISGTTGMQLIRTVGDCVDISEREYYKQAMAGTPIYVSDVIVARSGAMSITEISNLGKPSILIPLPNVSGDHQLYNAKVLENVGAAKIILNDKLKGSNLNDTINKIVIDKNKMKMMQEKALTKAAYDVEAKIYEEIKKVRGE